MTEKERYEKIDMPFYRSEIEPLLPAEILDFHAHFWTQEQWKENPFEEKKAVGGAYMVTSRDYPVSALLSDAARIFPGKTYKAVCFGNPTPAIDTGKVNDDTEALSGNKALYPLILAGRDISSSEDLRRRLSRSRIFGYKVFLNWYGDNYGTKRIEEMLSDAEMSIADEHRLIVLLHVPRSGRLADPEVQEGVLRLSRDYPNAQIVLAHCGRCYLPDEMLRAAKSVRGLPNVFLDTSMVMDPTAVQILLDEVGPGKLLFATDFPVPVMRGRRVYVMDHWVDLVLTGYEESAYRVQSENMRASFMAYEIVLAVRRACERCGIPEAEQRKIYHDNGMALLEKVKHQ